MYQLNPQEHADAETDVNPASVLPHYGKSWKLMLIQSLLSLKN